MAPATNWSAAIIFYILFVSGILVFVVFPSLKNDSILKVILLGLFFRIANLNNEFVIDELDFVKASISLAEKYEVECEEINVHDVHTVKEFIEIVKDALGIIS